MFFEITSAVQGEVFTFFASRINEGGVTVFEEPKKGAPKVTIRSMAPFIEERMKGRKKIYETVHNPVTRGMERISYYPDLTPEEAQAERDDLWDYVIESFEEKFTDHGKVIPCNREGKLLLMKNPVFDRFVARCQQLLSSSGVKEKEEAEKN